MMLLDTNILLRAAQPSHSLYSKATSAVQRVRSLGYVPCIVPQVLYEYWVAGTRPLQQNGLGMTAVEAEEDVTHIIQKFHLLRNERTIFEQWRLLVTQHQVLGKNAHDARLVAAMHRHGITHLLTFNESDFRRFPDITVVGPENMAHLPVVAV